MPGSDHTTVANCIFNKKGHTENLSAPFLKPEERSLQKVKFPIFKCEENCENEKIFVVYNLKFHQNVTNEFKKSLNAIKAESESMQVNGIVIVLQKQIITNETAEFIAAVKTLFGEHKNINVFLILTSSDTNWPSIQETEVYQSLLTNVCGKKSFDFNLRLDSAYDTEEDRDRNLKKREELIKGLNHWLKLKAEESNELNFKNESAGCKIA